MRAGLESLDRFAVWREDGSRMIEACQSPVWDTCLATIALADAGRTGRLAETTVSGTMVCRAQQPKS
ncbi:hypothetical protein EAO71_04820 [Streptomyces sp. ms191]|nr:hypothetical protein EAO71_04820 [Streptomyces sp. ms191]